MVAPQFQFTPKPKRLAVIAGPCMAESLELLQEVVEPLQTLAKRLDFDLVFKSSFDKANRTSVNSYRGPGLTKTCEWFQTIKSHYNLPVLTDIHETAQIDEAASVCDVLQIPAFLCRQTDLIVGAVRSGRAVNVKKGQFLAPENAQHIAGKVKTVCTEMGIPENYAITERGASFGYGNLVVDMRSFPIMKKTGASIVFDVTHSLQLPASGQGEVTGGLREFAPVLARAAIDTGAVDGLFLEVHPNPAKAKSDQSTQLSLRQAEALLTQVVPLWHQLRLASAADEVFLES